MQVPFVDLKAQYREIKAEIDAAMADVLGDTAFVSGKYAKIFEQAFDDHVEGQGDNGQIVSPGAKRRKSHHQTGQGGNQAAHHQDQGKEKGAESPRENPHREDGGNISANGHETGVAHGKLTHVTVHQVQGQSEDHVDPHIHEDLDDIGV